MRISDWSSDVCSSYLTAIAVIIANQARIIGERLGIRTVGTKRLRKLFCHAIFVFSGGDMDHITLPARSGLDAEQVVTGGAVGTHDLTLPPPLFQRRLTQYHLFRTAAFLRTHASSVGNLRNKDLYLLGSSLTGRLDFFGPRVVRTQIAQVAYG